MIEVNVRLGWEADSLTHGDYQYEANEDGTFTLPQDVYFELRDRGMTIEYISEEQVDETEDDPGAAGDAEGDRGKGDGGGVISSTSSPSSPVDGDEDTGNLSRLVLPPAAPNTPAANAEGQITPSGEPKNPMGLTDGLSENKPDNDLDGAAPIPTRPQTPEKVDPPTQSTASQPTSGGDNESERTGGNVAPQPKIDPDKKNQQKNTK